MLIQNATATPIVILVKSSTTVDKTLTLRPGEKIILPVVDEIYVHTRGVLTT